jgi:hypothetical protein
LNSCFFGFLNVLLEEENFEQLDRIDLHPCIPTPRSKVMYFWSFGASELR